MIRICKSTLCVRSTLKEINEVIVQASLDTGACYGVSKCAEIVFERGKMVKGEGLQVLQERMKTLDPDQEQMYKSRFSNTYFQNSLHEWNLLDDEIKVLGQFLSLIENCFRL